MKRAGNIGEVVTGLRRRRERAVAGRQQKRAEGSGLAPVIIFTLPKTGSSTMHRSLLLAGLDRHAYHVHKLSDDSLARADARLGTPGFRMSPEKRQVLDIARRAIDDPGVRPVVVSATRHPLSRAISAFFQGWQVHFPWIGDGQPVTEDATHELVDRFHVALSTQLAFGDSWFEDELRTVTGIDAFASAFDRSAGWQVLPADCGDFALVRLEDLARAFMPMMSMLLGSEVPLHSTNLAATKAYQAHHLAFRSRLRLTADEIDAVRSSRLARHFYASDEIEGPMTAFMR